jgi:hypothetical protein
MKRLFAVPAIAAAVIGCTMAAAPVAMAFPTKTSACTSCHGTAASTKVAATQTANDGTNATYAVTVTGGAGGLKGWAVLKGASNLGNASATTGTFKVPVGSTYTLWAVDTADGATSIQLSPVAPPVTPPVTPPTPPTTPPVTPPVPPVTPPTPPTTPPVTPPTSTVDTAKVTIKVHFRGHTLRNVTVVLVDATTGARYTATTDVRGNANFGGIPYGEYKVFLKLGGKLSGIGSVEIEQPRASFKAFIGHRLGGDRD